jgi:cyclic pyranopterin phosphate synthase
MAHGPDVRTAHPQTIPALETGPRSIHAVRVLRISLTDRCNFRCSYCMPPEGVAWLPKHDLLSFDEILDVVRAAVGQFGISRFKLTGGEPLVRPDVVRLVERLAAVQGVGDLSLTTNGSLLPELARPLRDAGLHRVTVSLDSLRADRFKQITRTGDLATVLRGLDAAESAGFASVKINCVTMRGLNDDELVDFARLTLDRAVTVRFIEYMPLGDSAFVRDATPFVEHVDDAGKVSFSTAPLPDADLGPAVADEEIGPAGGCGAQDRGDVFLPEAEVRTAIESELGPLVAVDRDTEPGAGPAVPWRLAVGRPRGRIGFISAMSSPFCATCNRLRLTASGILRSCLFEGGEVDLKPILRASADLSSTDRTRALAHAFVECVRLKPEVHSRHGNEQMSRIGG